MATTWRLLLLAAAAAVASSVATILVDAGGGASAASCGGCFVASPASPLSNFCGRNHVHHFDNLLRPLPLPLGTLTMPSRALAMSKSPNLSLQEQIIQGATMKLLNKEDGSSTSTASSPPPPKQQSGETASIPDGTYSYYIREALRSEINEIADVLMTSFHPDSQPTFDSYIRRYKYNHLQMCFDAIEECDRGLYVACAVPASPSSEEKEQIVGFCSVDGRTPDPSCKIEFMTPSTLAGTSPRPYLSDLGVSTLHRRQGIGEKLVRACEQWTRKRGYERLYLKVEDKNIGGIGLYTSMGYRKTKLPWGKEAGAVESRWDTTVLLEKSVKYDSSKQQSSTTRERRKRTWIKNQLWNPIKKSVNRYSAMVNNNAPPL